MSSVLGQGPNVLQALCPSYQATRQAGLEDFYFKDSFVNKHKNIFIQWAMVGSLLLSGTN